MLRSPFWFFENKTIRHSDRQRGSHPCSDGFLLFPSFCLFSPWNRLLGFHLLLFKFFRSPFLGPKQKMSVIWRFLFPFSDSLCQKWEPEENWKFRDFSFTQDTSGISRIRHVFCLKLQEYATFVCACVKLVSQTLCVYSIGQTRQVCVHPLD